MEHIATWMFIGGDAVFFLLEIFMWFYLRTLNTNGMWRGVTCSKANPCAIGGGSGYSLTSQVTKADPLWTFVVAGLIVVSAAFIWFAESQARKGATRQGTTGFLGLGLLFALASIGVQIYQFQVLPFQTTFGAYASTFEFYMGSNIAHFLLVALIAFGLLSRSRMGKYENGSWYQLHLSRLWTVWVAASATILALIAVLFA